MSKKKNRKSRRERQAQPSRAGRPKGKRRINRTSLVFIGLILLMVGFVAVVSLFDGDTPECPPGLVWSDAHNHCH